MPGISERNRQQNELARAGFTLRYIDDWSPRITLYRHKPSYNVDGAISEDVGSTVSGVPGEPSYVLKKAKMGLFPWKPNEGCACQWCNERNGTQVAAKTEVVESAPESGAPVAPLGRGKRRMGPHFNSQV